MPFTTCDKLGSRNGIFTKLQIPKGGFWWKAGTPCFTSRLFSGCLGNDKMRKVYRDEGHTGGLWHGS